MRIRGTPATRGTPRLVDLRPADLEDLLSNASRASKVLKAIANRVRLLLVCGMVHGDRSVSELQALVSLSQSAVSQHLALLRSNGIVKATRRGQSVHYRLASPEVAAIIATLHKQFCKKRR